MSNACRDFVIRQVILIFVLLAVAPRGWAASLDQPLDYFLVVTGGELLEGMYGDAHTPFITRTLRPLGGRCVGVLVVDDLRPAMLKALAHATNCAGLVIVTGGLGPTPNDITRETLSEFTGIPLREHPEVLAAMEQRLGNTRDRLRANLRRQTLVPIQGGYLPNAHGTAVGLTFETKDLLIVALPGPPRELQPMVQHELVPFLQRRYGLHSLGVSITMRFVGAGQSQIDQTLKEQVRLAPDVIVTSLFEGSRVDFTFSLPGHAAEDYARLRKLKAQIREHLGDFLYAEDGSTLEEVVVNLLIAARQQLLLLECGTAGQLAAAISGARGSSELLAGAYVAPSETALAGLVNAQVDERGSNRERLLKDLVAAGNKKNQWVVAVGTPESAASGRSVVVLVQDSRGRTTTRRLPWREGDSGRAQLVTQILDALRRELIQRAAE